MSLKPSSKPRYCFKNPCLYQVPDILVIPQNGGYEQNRLAPMTLWPTFSYSISCLIRWTQKKLPPNSRIWLAYIWTHKTGREFEGKGIILTGDRLKARLIRANLGSPSWEPLKVESIFKPTVPRLMLLSNPNAWCRHKARPWKTDWWSW